MAITTRDGLIDAMANNSSRIVLDKATLASQLAGGFCSMWRATGQPAQGAIPTTAAICDNTTLGGLVLDQQTLPVKSYLTYLTYASSNAGSTLEMHDRLCHSGGCVLNVTTSQTTNLPLNLTTLGVPAARYGDANFSDVMWWLEIYTAGGATASNATINVTFDDNSTGNLTPVAVGGTLNVGRMIALDILRTTAQQARNIKGINSVILSASTGTAGNFGFTCTRTRATLSVPMANQLVIADWAMLGLPEIGQGACITPVVFCVTTSAGTVRGQGKVSHG